MLNKSEIMKKAWANAKSLASAWQSQPRKFIAQELSYAWRDAKEELEASQLQRHPNHQKIEKLRIEIISIECQERLGDMSRAKVASLHNEIQMLEAA